MSANFDPDEWWRWRNRKDDRDHKQDNALHRLDLEMAVLKTRQEISADNEGVQRSHMLPRLQLIIASALGALTFLLQLWAMGGRIAP